MYKLIHVLYSKVCCMIDACLMIVRNVYVNNYVICYNFIWEAILAYMLGMSNRYLVDSNENTG